MITPPKPPSMFEMLLSASAGAAQTRADSARPPWPPNPFPPGMREGKCTQRVLDLLRQEAPRHLEHGQIRMRLGMNRGAVTWATKYLEFNGLVQRVHDPRHPHYKRWRITEK